ncbi:MAG: DUF4136 domain-containing protein [Desulfatitalea sp.]|nr:DUF4136 domain-containing protein [Desulfatitalea sp.]NNK02247.1 DUF4136 domain-containing protein [Desulfatitalea sp.]
MKTNLKWFLLFTILTITACSSIAVNYDYDTKADLSKYKTYNWMPSDNDAGVTDLTTRRIKAAVDRELKAKAYEMTENNPDFLVATHVKTKEKLRVTDWGYTGGFHYWSIGGGVDVRQTEEGSIIIDLVDAKSKNLFWRGMATSTVRPNLTAEKQEKLINRAVERVFEKAPQI